MRRLALAAAIGMLTVSVPATTRSEEVRPDFSGSWILDGKRSEDPLEKMREARRSRHGRSGTVRGPEGGEGGGRGGGRPEGGPGNGSSGRRGELGGGEGSGFRARMVERERAAMKLTIRHLQDELAVHDGIGRDWSLTIGDEEREVPLAEGEPVRARAEWGPGGRLSVRWVRPYSGPVVVETYELVAEGQRLLVKVRLEGDEPRAPFEFLRVYGRAPESRETPESRATPEAKEPRETNP